MAVKATMGTLNVQNGDAGKGHAISQSKYTSNFLFAVRCLFCFKQFGLSIKYDLLSFSVNYCKPKTLIIN